MEVAVLAEVLVGVTVLDDLVVTGVAAQSLPAQAGTGVECGRA